MTIHPRAAGALLALVVACGTTPAPPRRALSLSVPPTASAPLSAASASAPPASGSAALPEDPPSEEATAADNLLGTIDADQPPAPCDFARYYRGKVGEQAISVALGRSGATLRGFSAYDAGFGDIEVVGAVQPDGTLTLAERKDGKDSALLTGSCAAGSGVISGTWKQGAITTKPFTLKPRDANGVALVQRVKSFESNSKGSSCNWNVRSPAVFGLGDVERTARINGLLRVRFDPANEEEMERKVARCPPGGDNQVHGWYSIEANTHGLLSVVENGYTYFGPAAHGDFSAAAAAISVDIPTGRRLALTDVVTSSKALRPLVKSCMKLLVEKLGTGDEWWWERDIQGVPSDKNGEPVEETSPSFVPRSLRQPAILVLPDGIAALIGSQPTVSATFELRGPVIRWSALLREGALKERSPVARLWAKERRADAGDPACARIFEPGWVKKETK